MTTKPRRPPKSPRRLGRPRVSPELDDRAARHALALHLAGWGRSLKQAVEHVVDHYHVKANSTAAAIRRIEARISDLRGHDLGVVVNVTVRFARDAMTVASVAGQVVRNKIEQIGMPFKAKIRVALARQVGKPLGARVRTRATIETKVVRTARRRPDFSRRTPP